MTQTPLTVSQPSPAQLRQKIVDLALNDLVGPRLGETEELDESGRLTDIYILGTVAPRHRRPQQTVIETSTSEDETTSDLPGEVDLVPEEIEVDDFPTDVAEDEQTDAVNPPSDSLFPSAVGLSFCVESQESQIQLTAAWGQYHRVKSESITTEKRNQKTVWQREPISGTILLSLQEGVMERWQVSPEYGVFVEGQARRLPGRQDWLVTLFLINEQQEPEQGQGNRDTAWLFQPQLCVTGTTPESYPFVRRSIKDFEISHKPAPALEQDHMAMLYRNHCEFAIGHGISVQVQASDTEPQRACKIETAIVPRYEVPNVSFTPPQSAVNLQNLILDMKALAERPFPEIAENLAQLPQAYGVWLGERQAQVKTDVTLQEHQAIATEALKTCAVTQMRLKQGLDVLAQSFVAQKAFRFMNRAMRLQRLSSLYSRDKRRGGNRSLEDFEQDPNSQPQWRLFQLAFILINVPSLVDPRHSDRSGSLYSPGLADLLFFPTGGGKTEAYLGLTAFTLAMRRLQPNLGDLDAGRGVAVLMRYTLRLLTLQQFQRATALICACEVIRQENPQVWGTESFRIGLWVGMKTTPNTTQQAEDALDATNNKLKGYGAATGTPKQLSSCPWCGSNVRVSVDSFKKGQGRTRLFCDHPLGNCVFTESRSPDGLPVMVVDEEIYRRPPALLIATVDKFAQMPWKGEVQNLFGYVQQECPRHGFFSPELEDSQSHPQKGALPAVQSTVPRRLRPPDLIIQDELHLISGPLGSLVGLYETAIDTLCSWTLETQTIRPKIIASTATIRQAQEQVHRLFNRDLAIFPPQALDISDNFFARQLPTEQPPDASDAEWSPGRLYLGICSPGRRLKSTLIRVYTTLLAASQEIYQAYPHSADAWMTLVGYFNALRDLGSTYRLVDDEVRTRTRRQDQRGLANRNITVIEELNSRKQAGDIPAILDKLERRFPLDPNYRFSKGEPRPVDILLATNMISVGVDVDRLGLMVVTGQPKNTAEYIQATSRVGRSSQGPGLVVTLYNWSRPRDLSHYETFAHYHATFYQQVEALSLTPFSAGCISRGLAGVLAGLVRLHGDSFNDNLGAGRIQRQELQQACTAIKARAEAQKGQSLNLTDLEQQLEAKIDYWLNETRQGPGISLGYQGKKATENRLQTTPLLKTHERNPQAPFATLMSLRNVEATVNLVLAEPKASPNLVPEYQPFIETREE